MIYIVFLVIAAYCIIILINPKLASALIWLPILIYPNGWWYNQGYLPLNMGADDLLCILLFIVFIVKHILIKRKKIKGGYGLWVISAFVVVVLIANLNGMVLSENDWSVVLKPVLKAMVYWCLFFCVLHSIDDKLDLRRQISLFSFACAMGGMTVLLQYFNPEVGKIFASPAAIKNIDLYTGMRASGSFMNPNGAACILAAAIPLVITSIKLSGGIAGKTVSFGAAIIIVMALYATQSRSGLIAGVVGMLMLMLKSRQKGWAIIITLLIVVTGVLFTGARESFRARVEQTYTTRSESYDKNLIGRVDTWKAYLNSATPSIYIFGQGFDQGVHRNGMESHNAYISLLTVYGIGGVVWFLMLFAGILHKGRKMKYLPPDESLKATMNGILIAFVIWCVYGFASDSVSSEYPRYLLFFIVCLSDRIANLCSGDMKV